MIFMPPGSAKSTYASVLFPSWFMGKNEKLNVIAASYGQELSDRFGRKVRGIIRGEEYQGIFDAALSDESQAASRFALTTGGEYYGVGVGGSVTGFRADLGIIDDPVKSRQDADSETIRAKTIEWYKSDFWTRLKPGARQVLIMTRWHEEDLAGWLLESGYAGEWEVLSLPMESEGQDDPLGRKIGERLWPDWFTDEMVQVAKRDSRNWAALYQQRPAPESGDFFKREWIRYYETAPNDLRIYGASDYAVTSKGGDWTVHGVCGVDPDDNIYLLDWWRGQSDSLTWANVYIELLKRWKPLQWAEEGGVIDKSVGPLLDRMQLEAKAYCHRQSYTARQDKSMRAQAIRGRIAQGKVYFPKSAPWVADLIHEMLIFPNGKHDDQVDVLGLFGRMLYEMQGGVKPKEKRSSVVDTRKPTLGELTAEHDRQFANDRKDRFL